MQLNKITIKTIALKVPLVISISLSILFSSCQGDKALTNMLVSQIVGNYDSSIKSDTKLCFKNDNSEVLNILKTFKTAQSKDSLYNGLGIDNPFIKKKPIVKEKLELFLIEENYQDALKQANRESIWSKEHFDSEYKINFSEENCSFYISNPIYSKDRNIALVFVKISNHSSIELYELNNDQWVFIGNFANFLY